MSEQLQGSKRIDACATHEQYDDGCLDCLRRRLHSQRRVVNRESELLAALSAVVRAYDHPADGTAHGRMRAAIVDARKFLGYAPVRGLDGEPA